jgi:Zn-dependent protease with chaperone function
MKLLSLLALYCLHFCSTYSLVLILFLGFLIFFSTSQPIDALSGFFMHIISRRHEFQADAFAKSLGLSSVLKTGLIKIHAKNLANLNPDKVKKNRYSFYIYLTRFS